MIPDNWIVNKSIAIKSILQKIECSVNLFYPTAKILLLLSIVLVKSIEVCWATKQETKIKSLKTQLLIKDSLI